MILTIPRAIRPPPLRAAHRLTRFFSPLVPMSRFVGEEADAYMDHGNCRYAKDTPNHSDLILAALSASRVPPQKGPQMTRSPLLIPTFSDAVKRGFSDFGLIIG